MRSLKLNLVDVQCRIDQQLRTFSKTRRPDTSSLSRELRAIVECVHVHLYDAGFNVKTLKETCGIRTNNISSRFRWAMGIRLRDYIEARRMEAADHLLRTTDVGIFDLAMALGYEHETTFYRAFRRHFGCTPAALRRKCQDGKPRQKSRSGRRVEMQR